MNNKKWYQDWLAWAIICSIGYGTLCLLSLASDVGRPFPGFLTYHNTILTRMDLEWNTPSWWWGTTGDRPSLGDVLIRVDETPFTDITKPVSEAQLYQAAWNEGRATVKVVVLRNEHRITFSIPLEIFSWAHYSDLMLLPIVLATCYWLLAIILYRASNDEGKQRLVILILCAIATLGIAVRGSLFIFGSWREAILLFINPLHSISGTFMGALLIHLAFYFPFLRWSRLMGWLLPFVYGLAAILYLCFLIGKITVWQVGATSLARWVDKTWFDNFQYLIIIGIISILARMSWDAIFMPKRSREREEARIILVAFILFLPAVWFAIHGISGSNTTVLFLQSLADNRFLSLAVPFAFAAISLRYHTFTGAERWLFLALVLAVSGFLANAGVAILFWQQRGLIRELPFPPTAVLFLLFLLIGLAWGWQSGWRGWLGRIFQWERVSYHEVQQYGQRLVTAPHTNTEELAQTMVEVLCQELQVTHTAVWLVMENRLKLVAKAGEWPKPTAPLLDLPAPPPLSPFRLGPNAPAWVQPLFPHAIVVMPLTLPSQLLGIMASGSRWDTAVFDDRDLDILALIAQQSAVFLQNARQTAQLRQADRQLLEVQEQTQRKIAQDLHDYVLPGMSQLQFQLQTTQNLLQKQPIQAHSQLIESMAQIQENTAVIRRIQQNLVIRPLEYGLIPYLEEMIQRFCKQTGIHVDRHISPDLDIFILDLEKRQAVFAVCQQALDNVKIHAQARHVHFMIYLQGNNLYFVIRDDGIGSTELERNQAIAVGHFGLRSMQIRLESVGGYFEFWSEAGQGTQISGTIPTHQPEKNEGADWFNLAN